MTELVLIVVAGILLVGAGLARGLTLYADRSLDGPAKAARAGASLFLLGALAVSCATLGVWSAENIRQLLLGLALATVLVDLVLSRFCGVEGSSPVSDLLVFLLLVAAGIAGSSQIPMPYCSTAPLFYDIRWGMFLTGTGGIVVAGCAALLSEFDALLVRRGKSGRPIDERPLHAFHRRASAVALLVLGAGLIGEAWWSWRATGSLIGGEARQTWLTSAWLMAGMGLVSWELDRRAWRWAARFSVLALVVILVGLLGIGGLRSWLGI